MGLFNPLEREKWVPKGTQDKLRARREVEVRPRRFPHQQPQAEPMPGNAAPAHPELPGPVAQPPMPAPQPHQGQASPAHPELPGPIPRYAFGTSALLSQVRDVVGTARSIAQGAPPPRPEPSLAERLRAVEEERKRLEEEERRRKEEEERRKKEEREARLRQLEEQERQRNREAEERRRKEKEEEERKRREERQQEELRKVLDATRERAAARARMDQANEREWTPISGETLPGPHGPFAPSENLAPGVTPWMVGQARSPRFIGETTGPMTPQMQTSLDEYRSSLEPWQRRAIDVGLDPYDPDLERMYNRSSGQTIDLLRTNIPYADRVAEGAGQIGGGLARGAHDGLASAFPAFGLASSALGFAGFDTGGAAEGAGSFAAEALVPREAWELGIEALPGVGFAPDIIRASRAGLRSMAREGARSALSEGLAGAIGARGRAEVTALPGVAERLSPPPATGRVLDDPAGFGSGLGAFHVPDVSPIIDRIFRTRAAREGRPSGGVYDTVAPTSRMDTGILQAYEGRTGVAGLEIQEMFDVGNRELRHLGVGKWDGSRLKVERTPEIEQLFKALHGEGEPPARFADIFDDLKHIVAEEEAATIGFDPSFIPRDDYFFRGWRQPKRTNPGTGRGQVGATPGYKKPRSDATFSELLAEGYEPISWNPYEMAALRKRAGVEYREQQKLIEGMKEINMAVPADVAPEGWRVPKIGPAFEGKAFPFQSGDESLAVGRSPQWAVPDKTAGTLENIFGKRPSMGAVSTAINVGQKAKQSKLMVSLFQQLDFAAREFGSLTGASVGELIEAGISGAKLRPFEASKHFFEAGRKTITIPQEIAKLPLANISGGRQRSLRKQVLSGKPIFKERPGITLRGVSEKGWKQTDISLTTKDVVRDIRLAAEAGPPSWLGKATQKGAGPVARRVKQLNAAVQRGLFDGVYTQAQITVLKKDILPRLIRQRKDWTDEQIMAAAADEINKRFSTLANYQSVIQNPVVKDLARGLIFSTNETESLLRGAASTVIGPNKRMWSEYYLGTFLSLAATAALVHKATTGEWLPTGRLNPISRDDFGPFPISYNSKFLAPDIPLKGRNGLPLSLDLVMQMDTVFRLLDPKGFIESRENVIPRAIMNQWTGEDFHGNQLDTWQTRAVQFASDAMEPIGVTALRNAFDIGPDNETRIGNLAQGLQGAGLNIRAENNQSLRNTVAQRWAEEQGLTRPDGKPITKWSDLDAVEQDRALERFDNFDAELRMRRDEAAEQGQEFALQDVAVEAARAKFAPMIEANDAMFLSNQLTVGDFVEQKKILSAEQRGMLTGIYGESDYQAEPGTTRAWMEDFMDSIYRPIEEGGALRENGSIDGDEYERLESEFLKRNGEEALTYVNDYFKVRKLPADRLRDDALDQLDKDGFFDRERMPHYRNLVTSTPEEDLDEMVEFVTQMRNETPEAKAQFGDMSWAASAIIILGEHKGYDVINSEGDKNIVGDVVRAHMAQNALTQLSQGRDSSGRQFLDLDYFMYRRDNPHLVGWLNQFNTFEDIIKHYPPEVRRQYGY